MIYIAVRCIAIFYGRTGAVLGGASPPLAYFISSATGARVALATSGPSYIRGHFVIQSVGVFLKGISKKATDPSMYPFPFDCLF